MHPYQKIIQKAVEHIKKQQSPDGGFLSLSSTDPGHFSKSVYYNTTFFTSNILVAIKGLTGNEAKEIQDKGVAFLLNQKGPKWSFNYFAKDPEAKMTLAYPDDLDDTFAALAAIGHYRPDIFDGKTVATIVKLLISLEAMEGGPFKTWVVPDTAPLKWRSIDVVVNSTIGYFLSILEIELPNINDLIDQAARERLISSPYYPGAYQCLYFISRFYSTHKAKSPGTKEFLIKMCEGKLSKRLEKANSLEMAMLITTLANLEAIDKISADRIDSFVSRINDKGFEPHAFCVDPAQGNKTAYAGSSALTAALCAEALMNLDFTVAPLEEVSNKNRELHTHIQTLARAGTENLGDNLRQMIFEQIEMTSDERISSLPHETSEILKEKGMIIPDELTQDLALANMYGWMAYTIYDDIFDNESSVVLISCANFFLRKLTIISENIEKEVEGTRAIFKEVMDTIDSSNAWEQINCRIDIKQKKHRSKIPEFGKYENLASRSIGHALGPLVILLSLGYDLGSRESNLAIKLFANYLIARQLHDDARDWEDDLSRGRINSACVLILKKSKGQTRTSAELRKIFWENSIDEITALITSHVEQARKAREASLLFGNTNFMERELNELMAKAQKVRCEREKTLEFLNHYGPKTSYGNNQKKPLP